MSGGAGSAGGSGGMGQQPMGNAFAQPGGGIPSYAQPYMNNFGGGMGNASAGGFQGGSPFGMQQQQPYGMQQMQNPFGGQQMGALSSPGYGMNQFQQQQRGVLGQGGQQQMGQRPAYMDNPDFQAYQKQEQDLGRQMNEYMQKAPMYQQLQDLQGKLRGFQQPQQGQTQNPYGNIDQMQQQRNMQDQARQQQMWQQATQEDMRAAVMPPQTTQDDAMRTALGHPPLSSSKMGMPDYGSEQVASDFSDSSFYGGRGQQPEIGIGDFMRRQLPGPRMGGRGGYGQRPQQDYGYGQMQNQMQQQAQFGQQQRQQYGGLDALQQYLRPPSYRPPVVAPLPLDPGLTNPKPPPPPPPPPPPGFDNTGSAGF